MRKSLPVPCAHGAAVLFVSTAAFLLFAGMTPSARAQTTLNDLRAAAEQGNAKSQLGLGVAYEQGEGIAKDYQQALAWFRKAAAQGFAGAEYAMGIARADGAGVPKDTLRAVAWFRKAAAQGYQPAQRDLDRLEASSK